LAREIEFGFGKWCGDMALMDRFLTLYTCSSHREVTIDFVLLRSTVGGPREWNVTFVCKFNDWELDVVVEFFKLLTSFYVTNERLDGLRWKPRKNGVFDSRSFYYVLNDRPGVLFPWKSILGG
jgi:hypothetical protein